MQVWPRVGGPDIPDGPQRLARDGNDHEGLGRERFWDQTPAERAEALSTMSRDAGIQLVPKVDPKYWKTAAGDRDFAKGWMAELERVRHYTKEK
jgi:hypothetical protein